MGTNRMTWEEYLDYNLFPSVKLYPPPETLLYSSPKVLNAIFVNCCLHCATTKK